VERDDGGSAAVTIPVEADFLYVFSTADGLYIIIKVLLITCKLQSV